MFCSSCGTQVPDEANFCWKCGKPQKEGVHYEEPKYETCQIVMNNLGKSSWGFTNFAFKFQVDAIGQKGTYVAYETEKFTSDFGYEVKRNKYEPIINGLVNKLIQDGWEPVESINENWWNHRFRRRIR